MKESAWKKFIEKSSGDDVYVSTVKFPKWYDMKRDGITQSLLMSFMKCRKDFLLKLNRWSLTERRTTYANGSITHDMLDKVYTFYKKYQRLPSKKIVKRWCDRYPLDPKNKDWLPANKLELAPVYQAVAFIVVTEYMRYYRKIDFIPGRITGAEIEFNVIWKGFRLRGKRDLRFVENNDNWIMETKTMARIAPDTIAQKLTFDFQSLFYVHCEELESQQNVSGILYNIVRNPGQKRKQGEDIPAYALRIRSEIRRDPKHFFLRFRQPYSKKEKTVFRIELLHKLQDCFKLLSGKLYPYKNEKNCVGSFSCVYLKACACGRLIGYGQYKRLFSELEEQ